MPEAPEVETIRRVLKPLVKDKTIKDARVVYDKLLVGTTSDEFRAAIRGQKILDIVRWGKYLIFMLENNVVISHLRMEGRYYYAAREISPDDPRYKSVSAVFSFTDGTFLTYCDSRKFGKMYLSTEKQYMSTPPLAKLGVSPFQASGTYLRAFCENRRVPIKRLLLDQTILCGIGNIYADESLFAARVNPMTPAHLLSTKRCDELAAAINSVLRAAIEKGGTTVKSFEAAEGVTGRFQEELNVYGREGKPCRVCGSPIVKTRVDGRGTCFCPRCQAKTLPKNARVVGVTGLIGAGKSTVSDIFSRNGYQLIDADALAKKALDIGTAAYKKTIKTFSNDILNDDKTINRRALREKVAGNEELIKKLDAIIHPFVIRETKKIIAASPQGKFVLDVPLLFETKMNELCDIVVFVNIAQKVRRQRLIARGTMPLKDAAKLNKRVLSAAYKIARADYIIDNSLTPETTEKQIRRLLELTKLNRD